MNFFAFSNLLTLVANSGLSIFLALKGKGKRGSKVLVVFCLVVASWGAAAFRFSTTLIKADAFFWWQIGYICAILSSCLYYQFVCELLQVKGKIYRYISIIAHCLCIIFLLFNFFVRELFIGDLRLVFDQFYWTDWPSYKTPLWLIYYITLDWFLLGFSFFLLLRSYFSSKGVSRNQLKYFLLGSVLGWIAAHSDYLVTLRVNIYPYANILMAVYPAIWAYAIIRYRLMDIKIAITRSGIFLALYTVILGLPFYIGYHTKSWFLSTSLAVVFASIGPLGYRFFRKKAEDLLLAQQRRYQQVLVKATQKFIKVYQLERLLKWIVYTLKRVVGIKYAAVFLDDKEEKVFRLRIKRGNGEIPDDLAFSYNHPFIVFMQNRKEPFFFMELPECIKMSLSMPFEINVIIPSFIEDAQLGFLILGEKLDRTLYSADDITVFRILAHQAGLAIENARLYDNLQEEIKKLNAVLRQLRGTQDQLIQTEKIATVGQLVAGVAHEINNPLFVISGRTELLLDCRADDEYVRDSAMLIMEQTRRIQKIMERLLEFSRKKEFKQETADVNEILNDAIILLAYQSKLDDKKIIKELGDNLPCIFAEKNQLQEVFLNIMLNAFQAMEKGGALRINTRGEKITDDRQKTFAKGEEIVVVEFQDTGKGMDARTLERIFEPFFSTKEQGCGLGLSICSGIIERHQGVIEAYSQAGRGSTFVVKLPVKKAGGAI